MNSAVVEIAGKQFIVLEQEELIVPKLESKEGESVVFDRVLLVNRSGETKVGTPTVDKASVTATVVKHGKAKKILVFKKKRRKDYKKTVGHRQDYSVIRVDAISVE